MIIHSKRLAKATAVLACLAVCHTATANNCAGNLGDRADVVSNPPGNNYDVYFTDDDNTSSDFFDATRAGQVRDALSGTHTILTNATHNFNNPFFSDNPNDTCIDDSANLGTAPENRITLDAPGLVMQQEPFIRMVVAHELFHHVQYGYINFSDWPSWGGWTVEATARAMEDKLTLDNDTTPGNTLFVGEVNNYLANPNQTLMNISYTAALFWTYLMEQLGTPLPEPARGSDVIQRFWNLAAGNTPDSVGILRDTIESFSAGTTLEDMFIDFAITNYTHNLDVGALPDPARFQYFDESAAGGGTPYNAVARTTVPALNTPISDSVARWGVRYFEVNVPSEQQCEAIGFWGKAKDGKTLAWALIGIQGGNKVTQVYRSSGNEFYRALVNPVTNGYTKMVLVVAGLASDADFDYAFGWGPITGEIRRPTLDRMAYVGTKDEPEPFQTRLLMEGPSTLTPSGSGDISIRGLDATQFEVSVRSVSTGAVYPVDIVNSNYVSGEYWLVLQAPVISNPLDGDLYDLLVCFCKRSGTCTQTMVSAKSVLYADITLNQMLVMDVSGSMAYPAADPKIDAAKNAARLYVDAADDADTLGFAIFSGDNTECNNDASVEFPLNTVAGNRNSVINKIDAQGPGGWTSIGDGLKAGRDQLFGAGSPADVRSIVLMSDGMENEGDFWQTANGSCATPPVKNSFDPGLGGPAADMRVDSLAFGSDANQELLQAIAAFTDGDYYAVSTDAPASRNNLRAAAPSPAQLAVANRLANAYRSIEEDLHGQDRLFYGALAIRGGVPADMRFAVTEADGGGVVEAVVAFNWDNPAAGISVQLVDPLGNPIGPATPGWQIDSDATNKVYRLNGVMMPGNWEVDFSAGSDTQLIGMLSGRIRHGVDIDVSLSQVRGVLPQPGCMRDPLYRYLRGLPVGIQANLSDKSGGIGGLNVEAEILNPDGSVNRLVLFDDGNHDDGLAGDGIYGAAYTRTPFFSSGGVPDVPGGPPSGKWGSYSVLVTATGQSHFGETFQRSQTRDFQVFEFGPQTECFSDTDADGLPDRWEDLYGLDSSNPLDVVDDNDNDGLINRDEFWNGTHPFDADSDAGGESEGSELANGRDPLYQRDDLLPAILDYGVVTQRTDLPIHEPLPKTNILHFPVNSSYRMMEIWRTDPGVVGFILIDIVDLGADPSGVYYDDSLQIGFPYQYYLVAQGLSGARTAPTQIFTGTPKAEPLPPKGWVMIQNGQVATPGVNVTLQLDKSDDSTEVLVSPTADFAGAAWQPIAAELPYVLPVTGPTPFVGWVYIKYRDASQNESIVYHDSIVVDPNADNDGDGIADLIDNCVLLANPTQLDSDGDLIGNRCDPDINKPVNDCVVNFLDLGVLKAAFFSNAASANWNADADFNGDGAVNFLDLAILKAFMFQQPGPSAAGCN